MMKLSMQSDVSSQGLHTQKVMLTTNAIWDEIRNFQREFRKNVSM